MVPAKLHAAGKATHVVVVVWDGMRPDFVGPETTPTLSRLAQEGVTFRHHHPVYISTTEVNGTALATGVYPGQSGIIGNKEFRPAIDARRKTETESPAAIRQGDRMTGGHYLNFPTLEEMLHRSGLRTVIAGAKDVVLLHDRAERPANSLGVTLFAGKVLPESDAGPIHRALGAFPLAEVPKTNCDLWTTRALIGSLWQTGVPAFSLLWLSEPDHSQHETGPGSPTSLTAIRDSDYALSRVLAALDQKGLRDQTDVIVVSDHGFSTIGEDADVARTLNEKGFHAYRALPQAGARKGDIMVVSNGGSVFLYVTGHQPDLVERIAHCLQAQEFCGVVFTRTPVEGAFRLHDARVDSSKAPDIVLSMRWRPDKSANGTPGLLCAGSHELGPGQGTHGSLSRFDMHNTCIAAGPDFRKGFQDDLPSGNIDIAPTVLWLLGVKPERPLSGRVLTEALVAGGSAKPKCETRRLEASWSGEGFIWRQYLEYSQVKETRYFDEGNGEQFTAKLAGGN